MGTPCRGPTGRPVVCNVSSSSMARARPPSKSKSVKQLVWRRTGRQRVRIGSFGGAQQRVAMTDELLAEDGPCGVGAEDGLRCDPAGSDLSREPRQIKAENTSFLGWRALVSKAEDVPGQGRWQVDREELQGKLGIAFGDRSSDELLDGRKLTSGKGSAARHTAIARCGSSEIVEVDRREGWAEG
jgi:hypothetical protein